AMAADTSSSAATTIPAVGVAAAAFAAVSAEPMLATSVAAEVIISGAAITNDIPHLQTARDNPAAGWRSVTRRSYGAFRDHRGETGFSSCHTEQPWLPECRSRWLAVCWPPAAIPVNELVEWLAVAKGPGTGTAADPDTPGTS